MSILIKGMEMPKSCSVCPMLEGDRMDGLCHAASKWLDDDEHWTWYVYPEGDMDDSKPCNCPLAEIPQHGRLGDLDKAYKDALTQVALAFVSHNKEQAAMAVANVISNAPTILPAEEVKE